MTTLAFAMGWIAIAILGVLTYAFAHDPKEGLWTEAHRLDQLPRVMASRYVALGALGIGILVAGSLPLLALFFAVSTGLGAVDALIYARAGGVVLPHALAAGAALVAFCVTLAAIGFST